MAVFEQQPAFKTDLNEEAVTSSLSFSLKCRALSVFRSRYVHHNHWDHIKDTRTFLWRLGTFRDRAQMKPAFFLRFTVSSRYLSHGSWPRWSREELVRVNDVRMHQLGFGGKAGFKGRKEPRPAVKFLYACSRSSSAINVFLLTVGGTFALPLHNKL